MYSGCFPVRSDCSANYAFWFSQSAERGNGPSYSDLNIAYFLSLFLVYCFLIETAENSNMKLYNEAWKIMSLKRLLHHLIRSIFKFYLLMQKTNCVRNFFGVLACFSSVLSMAVSCPWHLLQCHHTQLTLVIM